MHKNSVFGKFLRLFFPCFLIAASTQLASIIDKIFVGTIISTKEMAAINVSVPISQLVFTLLTLLGVGTAANISINNGEGNSLENNKIFTSAICYSLIIGLSFFAVLFCFAKPLSRILINNPTLQDAAFKYYSIFIFSVPLRLFTGVLQNITRVDNHHKLGATAVVIANLTNVFFNWLFICKFNMGISGAAYGTVLCYLCELLINIFYFADKKRTLHLDFSNCMSKIKPIFSKGFAPSIGAGLISIKLLLLNRLVSYADGTSGAEVMAICLSCLSIITMFLSGIYSSIVPIAGEYYGKKDAEHFKESVSVGFFSTITLTTVVVLFLEFFTKTFIGLHGSFEPQTMAKAIKCVRWYAISLYGRGLVFLLIHILPIKGSSKFANLISACEGCIVFVPLCLIFELLFGLTGIWMSFIFTEIVCFVIVLIHYKGNLKRGIYALS